MKMGKLCHVGTTSIWSRVTVTRL